MRHQKRRKKKKIISYGAAFTELPPRDIDIVPEKQLLKMSATNAGASGSAAASSAATSAPEPKVDRVNEQLEKAKAFKTKGNEHYAKQEIPEALKQWHMVSRVRTASSTSSH